MYSLCRGLCITRCKQCGAVYSVNRLNSLVEYSLLCGLIPCEDHERRTGEFDTRLKRFGVFNLLKAGSMYCLNFFVMYEISTPNQLNQMVSIKLDEAPPPYVPPEKPEEPPPAYFPEEYTLAVEGRSHLVPPNIHASYYADSNNIAVGVIRGTGCHQRDLTIPIPPNYTCMAVIATIFFFPVGVFAIMYAIKARDAITAGNILEGWKYARLARILSRLSFILWTLMFTCLIIIVIVSANT